MVEIAQDLDDCGHCHDKSLLTLGTMSTRAYADAIGEALERLDGLGFERGAQGDFANHGPMGAEALATLGFTDDVANWVESYKGAMAHHEPPAARFTIDPRAETSWREALGRFDRAGDWEQLFERELRDEPWRQVLARWWPRLLPGLLAGLTHGLIRTAHAVRCLSATERPADLVRTELARGLAYWAARYTSLPGHARLVGDHRVTRAVARLPRQPLDQPSAGPAAAERLQRLQEFPGYADALRDLAPDDAHWMLSEMTTTFAGVYLAHPELMPVPLIHGVTAPAALRLVLPHLPGPLHRPSIAAMWQVHVALLLAFTRDHRAEGESLAAASAAELPPATDLLTRALHHGDEHVIKLAEACQREHALRPDPRFPAAVLAAQQRIAPR